MSILDVFGVTRARSTIYNWVHKADLQPETGKMPDHVAVDETVILDGKLGVFFSSLCLTHRLSAGSRGAYKVILVRREFFAMKSVTTVCVLFAVGSVIQSTFMYQSN